MKNSLIINPRILTLSLVLLVTSLVNVPGLVARHRKSSDNHDANRAVGHIQSVSNTTELEALKAQAKANHQILIVKFYSPTCSHCIKIAPHYSELSTKSEYSHVIFAEVNAPQARELSQRHNITGYPTFVIFDRNGREVKRLKGGNRAAIENALNELK